MAEMHLQGALGAGSPQQGHLNESLVLGAASAPPRVGGARQHGAGQQQRVRENLLQLQHVLHLQLQRGSDGGINFAWENEGMEGVCEWRRRRGKKGEGEGGGVIATFEAIARCEEIYVPLLQGAGPYRVRLLS